METQRRRREGLTSTSDARSGRLTAVALAVAACGPRQLGSHTDPTGLSAVLLPAPAPSPAVAPGPARWKLFARKAVVVNAARGLADGSTLFLGPGGERWTQSGSRVDSAETLLPANLVGALDSTGRLELLGEHGDLFVVNHPLGPLVEVRPPPRRLRSASAGRASILGIDPDGRIVRMVDGQPSSSPAFPFQTAVAQIAMRDDGSGLALGGPTQAAFTTDDGATWSPAPPVDGGARRVFVDTESRLVLEGLTLGYELTPRGPRWTQIIAFKGDPPEVPGRLPVELGGSEAIAEGRAALAGGKWIEIAQTTPGIWAFFESDLGQVPAPRSFSLLDGCAQAMLAADGAERTIACVPSGDPGALRLFRSDNEGSSYRQEQPVLRVTTWQNVVPLRLFALPGGEVLVQGACLPDAGGPCRSASWIHLGADGPRAVALESSVIAVRLAPDGAVYGLGTRQSWGGGPPYLFLLTSRDGGRSFASTPLYETGGCRYGPVANGSVAAGKDGHVAVVSAAYKWLRYESTDYGQHVTCSPLTINPGSLDFDGARGLALAPGHAWETTDQGANWESVPAPAVPSPRHIACSSRGCLIGVGAARLGWGSEPAPPEPPAVPATSLGAPIRCSFDDTGWAPAGDPFLPVDMMRGFVPELQGRAVRTWYSVADPRLPVVESWPRAAVEGFREQVDLVDASVSVVTYRASTQGIAARSWPLLRAARRDEVTALSRTPAGVAALRQSVAGPGGASAEVELAWMRAGEDRVHHRKVAGIGSIDWKEPAIPVPFARLTSASLLATDGDGVYVRISADQANAPLYFVRDTGAPDRLPWPQLPERDARGRPMRFVFDARHAGPRTLLTAVEEDSGQLVVAWSGAAEGGWTTRILGMWPEADPGIGAGRWRIAGTGPSLTLAGAVAARDGSAAWAWALRLGGPDSRAAPARLDGADTFSAMPPRCGSIPETAARVVVPEPAAQRHPVRAPDGVFPATAETGALLLAAPDGQRACVAAYQTDFAAGLGHAVRAFIAPGVDHRSVLFDYIPPGRRTSLTQPEPRAEVHMRTMTCRYEPAP